MKYNMRSIGVKLWLYFIFFAATILMALWLMQIVFLQSFYEHMKISDVTKVSNEIIQHYGKIDFETTIDKLTFRNSILVFVTNMQGDIIYTSDEHGPGTPNKTQPPPENIGNDPRNFTRPLPMYYNEFLTRLLQSENDNVSYTMEEHRFQGKSLIYGAKLPNDTILYVSTPLDPVNATTDILRTQLMYVTLAALLLSLVIAYLIAVKFSKPVATISMQADQLAKGNFDITFDKGFCLEIDNLSATLDHTAIELSKVENLRREFIANISHDLRTPLTMIKAYTEMIHDISGENKEKREAHLAIIAGETNRLAELVDDILDYSVIQSGNAKLEKINLNISELVKKVVLRFKPIFEHDGYSIQYSIEPDQYVLGDEPRLTQVLYNLISNAINYTGEDKKVIIKLSDLGGRVRFEVSDHGDGIPKNEIPLIWDRYYKLKDRGRTKSGTGLGLSIVKGILEMHDARFGAESKEGKGSKFWFEIKK